MSKLIVDVVKIGAVEPHPDPETTALELVKVKGWQCVVKKGSFKEGDFAVYFPLDSVLTEQVSEAIGVTKYLSKGRVKAARLRGTPSYGLLWPLKEGIRAGYVELESKNVGDDCAELLGVTKWEPPLNLNTIDAETSHPLFHKYTEIENYRNYPNVLQEGEEVVFTEKIHGENSRRGLVEGIFMAGSHNMRLKESESNRHWYTFDDKAKKLLRFLEDRGAVILFGEVFGWVQDLHYGMQKQGDVSQRVFDISINGRYMGYDEYKDVCTRFEVPTVPELYRGPFSFDKLMEFADSNSNLDGADNMMEGIVIRPVKERTDPFVGRVILKYVWDRYLNRKGGTEYK